MINKIQHLSYAYKMGFDCGKNGANTTNCNFSIFNSEDNTKEWERGKTDASKSINTYGGISKLAKGLVC